MTTIYYPQKILFENNEYILIDGVAITTKEEFENGTVSYAHLYPDGTIKRFNEQIGTISDITFTDEFVEVSLELDTFMDGLFGNSWLGG